MGATSARADVEISHTVTLAPHFTTGTANLDNSRYLVGGTVSAEITAKSDLAKAHIDSELQYIGSEEEVPLQHLGREAWIGGGNEPFDIRVGRQLLIWGRADRFNPTDNLTPSDFRFLTVEDQGQRFGATGVMGRYALDDDLSLIGVLIPVFESSILPEGIVGKDAPRPKDRPPPLDALDPGIAIKLDHTGEGFDGSLSYYRGHATSPALDFSFARGLTYVNPRIDVFGGDFAFSRGYWGFRGEMAYMRFDAGAVPNDVAPRSNIYTVLGIERQVLPDHLVLVQWLHRTLLDKPPSNKDSPLRPIGLVNAGIYSQFDRVQNGLTFSLNSRWLNETLRTEIAAAVWFNDGSYVLRPLAEYAITDNWSVATLFDYFGGPRQSNFGVLRDNTRWFIQLRRSF
jgi:hypothetical protein